MWDEAVDVWQFVCVVWADSDWREVLVEWIIWTLVLV